MTGFSLGQLLLLDIGKAQLDGIEAFFVHSLFLHNGAGAGFDDSDRDDLAGFIEDLRHADLLANDGFLHCISSLQVIG